MSPTDKIWEDRVTPASTLVDVEQAAGRNTYDCDWTEGRKDGRTGGRKDGRTEGREGRKDGRTEGQKDGRTELFDPSLHTGLNWKF